VATPSVADVNLFVVNVAFPWALVKRAKELKNAWYRLYEVLSMGSKTREIGATA
jgi:hypothetical protein